MIHTLALCDMLLQWAGETKEDDIFVIMVFFSLIRALFYIAALFTRCIPTLASPCPAQADGAMILWQGGRRKRVFWRADATLRRPQPAVAFFRKVDFEEAL